MKPYRYTGILITIVLLAFSVHFGFAAGLSDVVKGAQKALGGSSSGLSNDDIIAGLKQALEVGTEKAVGLVSKPDGYYKNPATPHFSSPLSLENAYPFSS